MVNAQPRIAGIGVPEIIPEGIDALPRIQGAQGVGPTLGQKAAERLAHLRPKQGIIYPVFRLIDVATSSILPYRGMSG